MRRIGGSFVFIVQENGDSGFTVDLQVSPRFAGIGGSGGAECAECDAKKTGRVLQESNHGGVAEHGFVFKVGAVAGRASRD